MKTRSNNFARVCVGIAAISAVIHLSCYELPSDDESLTIFESHNFEFHFNPEYIPPHEISAYARIAEQLLDYTLDYLKIALDDKIRVYVGYVGSRDYRSDKIIELSRDELENCDPLPITQAAISSYWEDTKVYYRRPDFVSAGLLQASGLQYSTNRNIPPRNPIDYFCALAESLNVDPRIMPPLNEPSSWSVQEELRKLWSTGAGAFIHYLKRTYGIAKIKELYEWSLRHSNRNTSAHFETVFPVSFIEAEEDFYALIGYPPNPVDSE